MSRLTIVQYAGDYREAHDRFAAGGLSTYQAQRYSLQTVADLATRHEQVAVVCTQTSGRYDQTLADGVRAIGSGFNGPINIPAFIRDVATTAPTHLVITTPFPPQLIKWALKKQLRIICVFADSFDGGGWRGRVRAFRLRRLLVNRRVEWVGNHGLNACLSLERIGVDKQKVVPWDWPPSFSPHDLGPRERASGRLQLVYVGGVTLAKGVGDLIEAVNHLRERSVSVAVKIIGSDTNGEMAAFAISKGVSDLVSFIGPVPNEHIPATMREADAVVVPSRHSFPEGMPLTIYEALSARTPILASDHPMFKGVLVDGESAVVFAASNPASMADAIEKLASDDALYGRLSANSARAWEKLQLPVVWGEFLINWLERGSDGARWLADHALGSGRYDSELAERQLARSSVR